MNPYTEEWEQAANRIARSFCPDIYPCSECNYPVVDGFCCTHCGNTNPHEASEESACY